MRPIIRNHFKGSKMALWLELVPKFHHADDLEAKYHLLTDSWPRGGSLPNKEIGTEILWAVCPNVETYIPIIQF